MRGRFQALALALAGWGLFALSAQAQAPEASNFVPGEAAKRLVPLKNAPTSGAVLTLQEHEKVLFAGIAVDALAETQAGMSVATGDIDWTIAPGSAFVLMTGFGGADSAGYAADDTVWCELKQREPRKETKDKAAIARLKKSHEQQVALCLIDSGNDGNWDKVIVTAAKRADLRRSFAITPVSYSTRAGGMLPQSYLAVKFHHQNAFHTPRFYVEGFLFGKPVQVQSLTFTRPGGGFETVLGSINTPPGELPRDMRYGEARFTVEAIDSSAKTARVRLDQAWGNEPIKITRIVYSY